MNLLVVLTFAALIAASTQIGVQRPEQYLSEWENYKNIHNKHYDTPAEDRARALIFIEKRRLIDNHNIKFARGEVSYKMGVNQFTDMTLEDSKKYKGLLPSPNHHHVESSSDSSSSESSEEDVPESMDWNKLGYVAPAEYQGACGSCYAFSSAALVESYYAIKNNLTNKVVKLSEQQIVDCSRAYGNSGCHGGLFENTFDYLLSSGLERESSYPYKTREGKCQFRNSEALALIKGYRRLGDDEVLIRDTVARTGPVAIAIQACGSLENYMGGIYEDQDCGRGNVVLNHAVVITGYGTENGKDFWIVKNSWGHWWGEKGFFRIRRGGRSIGIGMQSFVLKM